MNITFVSLPAYPIVHPEYPGVYGGTETRAVTLAKGLAQETDHQIQFLARHPQLKQPETIAQVQWHPWRDSTSERNSRIAELLQHKVWRTSLLWDIPYAVASQVFNSSAHHFLQADETLQGFETDLFCPFGVHSASAKVIHNAHMSRRKAVLFLGSNADVDARYRQSKSFRNEYGERSTTCAWILKNADAIVAQNEFQQQQLKEVFQRDSFRLSNPIDIADWHHRMNSTESLDNPFDSYVLWIGRADNFHKRADWAIEIARQTPELKYVMILNPKQDYVDQQIRQNCPENVHIISQLPFEKMPLLFRDASLLLNTSPRQLEGLPNTFLQAGASRVPIVSTEVDAGFVTQSDSGLVGDGSPEKTIHNLRMLAQDEPHRIQLGENAYDYISKKHELKTICLQLASFLNGVQ
ncbi:glycosyltransferase family 4 protein [Rubinisphaera italica]|uniref:Glycosyl transferases group 1 n=1 Tax=Rubinisphaera italica TaxID=2527969 RepID=A0A5C5XJV6_9PLAN|nr:glycosyltransferase family 4 protein [Rubinisphaera italica]TWT62405.1 Glycosyl transferases group 1 [Rubinisphaera italica]